MLVRTSLIFVAILLATPVTYGHMIMSHPIPWNSGLNNSPLVDGGSDFPCKQRGPDTYRMKDGTTADNVFPIGSNTTLSFMGSATHGGGSCQVSLTTDLEPTIKTKWHVIYSIEGGCPANTDGNAQANPTSSSSSSTFQFTIPDIAAGQYTLAWTWFNRIGNREMYMNCAPVNITSDSKEKRDGNPLDNYPEMFVANINYCLTPEGKDIRFPQPGKSVQYAGQPSNLQAPDEPACTVAPQANTAGLDPAILPTTTGTPSDNSDGSVGNGSSNPPQAATTTAGGDQSMMSTTTKTTAVSTCKATGSPETGSPSTSSSGALTGACTPEGLWNCIGGTSFQRCASGVWSVAQSVAAGTFCTPGQSADLEIAAGHAKREPVADFHRRRVSHGH